MTAPNKFCYQICRGEVPVISAAGEAYHGLIHVEDAARAMAVAARVYVPQAFTSFNAVTGVFTIREVASRVVSEFRGLDGQTTVGVATGSAPAHNRPNVRSRLTEFGFKPTRDLTGGLREVLRFFSPASLECHP